MTARADRPRSAVDEREPRDDSKPIAYRAGDTSCATLEITMKLITRRLTVALTATGLAGGLLLAGGGAAEAEPRIYPNYKYGTVATTKAQCEADRIRISRQSRLQSLPCYERQANYWEWVYKAK